MSIRSYQRNVERKVIKPTMGVCFPAALEQISPNYYYRPNIYREYQEFMDYLDSMTTEQFKSKSTELEYESMMEELVRPLGGLALDDVIMKKISTPLGLTRAINGLLSNDYGVVIDLKFGRYNPDTVVHSVGLIHVQHDLVTLVGTHVPPKLQGVISISKLPPHLAISDKYPSKGHPFGTANLIAIPNV